MTMRKFYMMFAAIIIMAAKSTTARADNWSIDFRGLVDENASVVISTDETVTIGGTEMGTCSYNGIDIDSKFVLQTGTSWLMRSGGLYQFNSGNRAFGLKDCTKGQTITITASGDPNAVTNATLKKSEKTTYIYTVTEDGDVKFNPARYLWFYTISVEDPSATAVNYKVKFVNEQGTEIKDAVTYDGNPGDPITILDKDKAGIIYEGVHYIYKSDDAEGQTIAQDGSTVITIVFREAQIFNYTITAVDGESNELQLLKRGEVYEGEPTNVFYTKAVEKDGVWYMTSQKSSEPFYGLTINGAMDATVTYNASEACYFSEVEDLTPSHSWAADGIVPNRYANGVAKRLYKESYVKTAALPAGIYSLTLRARNNSSSTVGNLAIYLVDPEGAISSSASSATFSDWGTAEQAEKTAEGIIVPEGYAIALNNATEYNSNLEMDYLYLVKTGDPELAQYTVKFVDTAGAELKTETRSGAVGVEVSLSSTDKAPFTVTDSETGEETVYIYQSDDSEGKIIAATGTVVTITFKKAEAIPYTITAIDSEGTALGTVSEGTITETLSKTVYYTKAVKYNDKWYSIEQNSTDPYYGMTIAAGENPTLTYTLNEDIDYFSEVENLRASHSWAADGAFPGRYANGQAKRLYKNSYVTTDPLPAGEYSITLRARNNNRSEATLSVFTADANKALTSASYGEFEAWAGAAQAEKTIEGVKLPEGFSIAIVNTDEEYNSNLEMDYVIVKRTGDYAGLPGDVDGDGNVSLADILLVVDYILTEQEPDGFIYANANLNNDDKISLGDILMIVDIILKQ